MSRLYHYTSVSGLRGIIDSGNIRATHLGFLNDLSEGRAAASNEAYRERLAETDKRSPLFIASFCRHLEPHQQKNGLLSQWRGYAGEGGGYCVVFDEEALDGLVEAERRISPGLTILKKDILYAGAGQRLPPAKDRQLDFIDLAAFVKSEVFREENETRITLAVPPARPAAGALPRGGGNADSLCRDLQRPPPAADHGGDRGSRPPAAALCGRRRRSSCAPMGWRSM